MKGKPTPQNKFEVIASRVIQYRIREGVSVRRQETKEKGVQCFRYQKMGVSKYKGRESKEKE